MARFEIGKKYYASWYESSTLEVVDRTDTTVTVHGWKYSRHRILTDEKGNEYFEIKDHPYVFRYRALNRC